MKINPKEFNGTKSYEGIYYFHQVSPKLSDFICDTAPDFGEVYTRDRILDLIQDVYDDEGLTKEQALELLEEVKRIEISRYLHIK